MMDLNELRREAQEMARDFLTNDQEYRMGYIEAEKPHPLTRRLSQTYAQSIPDGVRMLLSVDHAMAHRAVDALKGEDYARFADLVRSTLRQGGRVIWSGCGSSGRLSMRLEQSWRNGVAKLSARYPQAADALAEALERVGNIMTGGDYAVIRAAEAFEDSTLLGRAQARQWQLTDRDLLVGVTATGETTSILGTAAQALDDGAKVYMLICSDPKPLLEKMARAKGIYDHPNCSVISLPCGPMALTGSTRMQSSTFEQFAGAVALEGAFHDILNACGVKAEFPGYGWYAQQFEAMVVQLMGDTSVAQLASATRLEQNVYEQQGLITLFAHDYLLDVLTDTTERSPTFMTPPFCSEDMVDQPQSWAFVKNPTCNTQEAWTACFLRQPRCIDWPRSAYEQLGMNRRQIDGIPDVSTRALARFAIGSEPAPARERAPASHAMWVDAKAPPASFFDHAARYTSHSTLTIEGAGVALPDTAMDLYEHLCVKLMLNTLSTGVMASMGRIHGNWMTCLAISNKKLMDRGARIVSDLCAVPYEQALEENFYSRLLADAQGQLRSPVQESIRRLGMR